MDNLAGHIASSPSATSGRVFVDDAGEALRVFVETSEFAYRPKLIRSLRNGGAKIAYFPTDAQVILVDVDTEAGRQFVKDWGSERDKVVLNWIWARKSIERGGPCSRVRIGVDSGSRQKSSTYTTTYPPEAGPSTKTISNSTYTIQQQIAQHTSSTSHPQDNHVNQILQANAYGITIADLQQAASRLQQSAAPGNGMIFPATQNYMLPPLQPRTQTAVPVNLVNEMLEVLRKHSTIPVESQSFPLQLSSQDQLRLLQGHLQANLSHPSPFTQSYLSMPTVSQAGTSASAPPSFRPIVTPDPRNSLTPAPRTQSPSLKRKTSPLETAYSSISSRRKGKGRAISLERPSKTARTSYTPIEDIDGSSSPSSSQTRPSGVPRNPGEIFKTDAGESMVFWVQMETRKRGDLLQAIKKNGGRIVAEILEADIAVLAQHSKPFEHWLKLANQANRPTVQPRFIHDCIAETALLDVTPYACEPPPDKPKRGRPTKPKSPQKDVSPKKKQTPRKRAEKTSTSPEIDQGEESETLDMLMSLGYSERSPSPPTNVVIWKAGKNLYSEEDREYYDRYVVILISREPDMTLHAIAQKLNEKLPHHSLTSWRSWLRRRVEEINNLRKKVYIARRKADEMARQQIPSDEASDLVHLSSLAPSDSKQEVEESVKDDFEVITEFLAGGGADYRSDDEVWQILAEMRPSRTALEWKMFWEEHGTAINEHVDRLMKLQTTEAVDDAKEDDAPAVQNGMIEPKIES